MWASFIKTRLPMRTFARGHVLVSQKVAKRDVFSQWIRIIFLRVGQTNVLRHDFVMWKIAYWEGFVS